MQVIGVDIACDRFVAFHPQDQTPQSFENTPKGFQCFQRWIRTTLSEVAAEEVQVVMEATGIYWHKLTDFLHHHGFRISVVNPAQVKFFARTQLKRSKTDQVDAKLIQHYGELIKPSLWHPAPEVVKVLQSTLKVLDEIKALQRMEDNRLHALVRHVEDTEVLQKLAQERLELLDKQRKTLEARVVQLLKTDLLKDTVERLVSVPGIGMLTAALLIAETTLFQGLHSGRAIGAYAGLSPALRQSGKSSPRAHLSRMGNSRLRVAAFMAAQGATHSHSPLGVYFRRLVAGGKPYKVALCALARKLLCIALAVFRSGMKYDPAVHLQEKPVLLT